MFEAETEDVAEDKILKKLQKMNDLIQIPVGRKLVTLEKKTLAVAKKAKKSKRKADRIRSQVWTVCENDVQLGTSSGKDQSSWTVSEAAVEERDSRLTVGDSQESELVSSNTPSTTRNKRFSPSSPAGNQSTIDSDCSVFSDARIIESTREKRKVVFGESESASPSKFSKRALRSSLRNVETNSTKPSPIIEFVKSGDATANDASPLDRIDSRLSPRCDAGPGGDGDQRRNRSVKIVSDSSADTGFSVTTKNSSLPSSVDHSSTKISSKKTTKYDVSKQLEKKPEILTSDNPAWIAVPKDQLASWVPKTDDDSDELDYDISGLFASPAARAIRRRRSTRPAPQEVKRSARLASKAAAAKLLEDKKVSFTRDNCSQEVGEYYRTIRSSPKNPYDASKTPARGILKPFVVPGPINPFYFPNGEPKLINLRKQRLPRL